MWKGRGSTHDLQQGRGECPYGLPESGMELHTRTHTPRLIQDENNVYEFTQSGSTFLSESCPWFGCELTLRLEKALLCCDCEP